MKNKTILLVDDSITNQLLIQNIFIEEGYNVSVATNGKEALKILGKQTPDLILLDLMMPEMDGYQVMEEIEKNNLAKNIPIIMVSAKTNPVNIKKALSGGAVDYIKKPIDINDIVARVKKALA